MVPTDFKGSNCVLGAPVELGVDRCDPLNVYRGPAEDYTPVVISCWKLAKEEIDELLKTGRIWLYVFGTNMPPVALVAKAPFPQ